MSFGLGSTTSIELPGESAGIMPKPDMTDGQRDQVAFGQAIAVTGIQEAAAIAGVVNGGIYNPPTVIKKAIDGEGKEVAVPRAPQRRVISEKSSAQVRDLMQAVIDSSNGQRNLKLDRYTTGGKTGTAQRADTSCRCYQGYVTSFVGFAPLDDPQILTYVVISNPRRGDTGTVTAAPAYRDIMNMALPRYSVVPMPGRTSRCPLSGEPHASGEQDMSACSRSERATILSERSEQSNTAASSQSGGYWSAWADKSITSPACLLLYGGPCSGRAPDTRSVWPSCSGTAPR